MSSFLLLGRHHAGIGWIVLQLAIGVVLCLQAWQAITALRMARAAPDGIDGTGLLLVPWMQTAPAADPGVPALLGRLRNVPGVLSATAANQAPYGAIAWSAQVWTATRPAPKHIASVFLVDETFASTLGLETSAGRHFMTHEFHDYRGDPSDLQADTRSVLLSSALAARLYGNSDPLGRPLQMAPGARLQVVGVFERLPPPAGARDTGDLAVLLPVRMARAAEARFIVRHAADPQVVATRIQAALSTAYPSAVVADPVDMAALREASLHAPRSRAWWWSGACIAWWASTLGLLMLGGQRWVQEHAREFSLRRAAGATGRQLARRLHLEYLGLACAAAAVGLAGGQWLLPQLVPGSVAAPPNGALLAAAAWAMLAVQLAAAWPARLVRHIPPHLVSRSPSVRL
ncbi:MAG TPA: ABC transporter permease [Ramlibacter sp.]